MRPSYHVQDDEQTVLTQYEEHRDKVDSTVGFHGLLGESYNFVAIRGKNKFVRFQHGYQCKDYQDYKNKLSPKDRAMVEENERVFFVRAQKLGLTLVRVYKINQGDRLCFDAMSYLHMTIIPGKAHQPNGVKRVLMVHHGVYRK